MRQDDDDSRHLRSSPPPAAVRRPVSRRRCSSAETRSFSWSIVTDTRARAGHGRRDELSRGSRRHDSSTTTTRPLDLHFCAFGVMRDLVVVVVVVMIVVVEARDRSWMTTIVNDFISLVNCDDYANRDVGAMTTTRQLETDNFRELMSGVGDRSARHSAEAPPPPSSRRHTALHRRHTTQPSRRVVESPHQSATARVARDGPSGASFGGSLRRARRPQSRAVADSFGRRTKAAAAASQQRADSIRVLVG